MGLTLSWEGYGFDESYWFDSLDPLRIQRLWIKSEFKGYGFDSLDPLEFSALNLGTSGLTTMKSSGFPMHMERKKDITPLNMKLQLKKF